MIEKFKSKCKILQERQDILNGILNVLMQNIISYDISTELNIPINIGYNSIAETDWLDEIIIKGETLSLHNKTENKHLAYIVCTHKSYHTIALGIFYKDDIIAPHFDFCVDCIIKK